MNAEACSCRQCSQSTKLVGMRSSWGGDAWDAQDDDTDDAWEAQDVDTGDAWEADDDDADDAWDTEDDDADNAWDTEDDDADDAWEAEDDDADDAWEAEDDQAEEALEAEDDEADDAWEAEDDWDSEFDADVELDGHPPRRGLAANGSSDRHSRDGKCGCKAHEAGAGEDAFDGHGKPIGKPIDKPAGKPVGKPHKEPTPKGKFRYFKYGVGHCRKGYLAKVKRAFERAHTVAYGARREIERIRDMSHSNRVKVWNDVRRDGSRESKESSLGFWFGATSTEDAFVLDYSIQIIEETVQRWERAFRKGFYGTGGQPVFIRCKKAQCVGGGVARHLTRNTVEFCRKYFDNSRTEQQRTITTLHEMGHWLYGLATKPRDERNNICFGGWNLAKNMCYRASVETGQRFRGGNPRNLALEYDARSVPGSEIGAGQTNLLFTMLNNVDNYVCWMWNRQLRASGPP